MDVAVREAKARLSELIAAAEKGERVVITRHGRAVAEIVPAKKRGGIDLERIKAKRKRLGLKPDPKGWPKEFDDPAFSRKVLGLE
jgi:prevent-host-death family protein